MEGLVEAEAAQKPADCLATVISCAHGKSSVRSRLSGMLIVNDVNGNNSGCV